MSIKHNNKDLQLAEDDTLEAYTLIRTWISRRRIQTRSCRTFYTPYEWELRKEGVLDGALLILVYDGSDVKRMVYGDLAEAFKAFLDKHGYYMEPGHSWSSGIYKR